MRYLSEQKVLKNLGIPDFRHVTKDQVIKLASMLPKMDPEVAKKALEQFPEFAKTSLDALKSMENTISKAYSENSESTKICYQTYIQIMETLKGELENGKDLAFEQKIVLLDKMNYVAQQIDIKDSENKNFILKLVAATGLTISAIIALLSTSLGNSINTPKNDNEFDEQDHH